MTEETKEILEAIVFSITYDNRREMIDKIIEFSSDETLHITDMVKLAKANKKQLRIQLNSTFQYYLENQI